MKIARVRKCIKVTSPSPLTNSFSIKVSRSTSFEKWINLSRKLPSTQHWHPVASSKVTIIMNVNIEKWAETTGYGYRWYSQLVEDCSRAIRARAEYSQAGRETGNQSLHSGPNETSERAYYSPATATDTRLFLFSARAFHSWMALRMY